MHLAIERIISHLEPGDVVPLDSFEEEYGPLLRRILLDEITGRGFVLDDRNRLGEVEICGECDGHGEVKNKCCRKCDGYTLLVTFGQGYKPYKQ